MIPFEEKIRKYKMTIDIESSERFILWFRRAFGDWANTKEKRGEYEGKFKSRITRLEEDEGVDEQQIEVVKDDDYNAYPGTKGELR